MGRIEKKFKELKSENKKAFITYIMAGDPTLSVSKDIALALERSGADLIELGIPFSDPLADGPTIQAASQRSLAKGANLKKIFHMARSLRRETDIPVIFMTYYNLVLQYGQGRFFTDCRICGVDGVIIPDLPYEESAAILPLARKNGVSIILLAAPTSPRKRLLSITKLSKGFIYYVSLTGVTGVRRCLPAKLKSRVRMIRSMTGHPVCVGFGVSNPEQAGFVAAISDGVIVGSAIVKIIGEGQRDRGKLISRVSRFARSLSKVIHGA